MKVLVTGSSGLIGSEAVEFYDAAGHEVVGADNNMRAVFFGPSGDTRWNLERLRQATRRFRHEDLDIREREKVEALFQREEFELVVHCAAQPSHDKAKDIPLVLEAGREHGVPMVTASAALQTMLLGRAFGLEDVSDAHLIRLLADPVGVAAQQAGRVTS